MEPLFNIVAVLFLAFMVVAFRRKKEHFMPQMGYKVDTLVAPNMDYYNKGEFWSVPGTYETSILPRSASVSYGAQIRGNMPDEERLAYRKDTPFATDGLVTPSGELIQPVTYDRFMYANKKSRNRALGDSIRGDLPIVPVNMGWFTPSVQPHLDLKEGAMNVMGGFDNSTNNKLAALMSASAGKALQTFGGTPFGLNVHDPQRRVDEVRAAMANLPIPQYNVNNRGDGTLEVVKR